MSAHFTVPELTDTGPLWYPTGYQRQTSKFADLFTTVPIAPKQPELSVKHLRACLPESNIAVSEEQGLTSDQHSSHDS